MSKDQDFLDDPLPEKSAPKVKPVKPRRKKKKKKKSEDSKN